MTANIHGDRPRQYTAPLWAFVIFVVLFLGFMVYQHYRQPEAAGPTSLSIIVSGDTGGWIVPCGCASNQSGGLLRRGTFVRQEANGHVVLVADAGGAASGTTAYHRTKFEAILRGEQEMGNIAHNLGGSEAALGADYLKQVARDLKVPFVSVNVRDAKGEPIAPAMRIVERSGKRIAFTGILSKQFSGPGLQVQEPREAVLETIGKHRGQYDALIVLAYVPEEELMQLAAALPEADALIGGPTGQSIRPKSVGSVLVASATNKGKFLVRLETDLSEKLSWSGKIVELDGSFQDDPVQLRNVSDYLAELGRRDYLAAETGFVPTLALQQKDTFRIAGTQSCLPCHQSDCKQWDGSKHALAWKTLETKGYHVDSYCQQCHTTGFGQGGGFVSVRQSPERTTVGCESCHGPSSAHVKDVKTRTPYVAKDQCIRCHDHENSPLFQYDAYWPRIVHGKEPATKPGKPSQP